MKNYLDGDSLSPFEIFSSRTVLNPLNWDSPFLFTLVWGGRRGNVPNYPIFMCPVRT